MPAAAAALAMAEAAVVAAAAEAAAAAAVVSVSLPQAWHADRTHLLHAGPQNTIASSRTTA